jgi:hypothetical protein
MNRNLNFVLKNHGLTIAVLSVVANEDGDIQSCSSTDPMMETQLQEAGNKSNLQSYVTCAASGLNLSNQLTIGSVCYAVERT